MKCGNAIVAVALLGAGCLNAASDNPHPRLAFFAFCMDTHDAKKRTLAEQAQLLKELGYDGAGHLWLDNLAERLKTLDAAGLKLFQVYVRLDLDGDPPCDARLKDAVALLKGRGTMLAVIVTGGRPSDESRDARAVTLIREIAAIAAQNGTRVALYPHRGDWLERFTDALRVARKVDRENVGVMFNLCHFLAVEHESQLRPQLESAGKLLLAVSINGSDTGAEVRSGRGNWLQPLDRGSFDNAALLAILSGIGYRGPVGLQCYGIPGDARDHLTRSMTKWQSLQK